MSEMVERLMDLLWEHGVTVTESDGKAIIALIQATPRERATDYYADPDVGPAVIPSA